MRLFFAAQHIVAVLFFGLTLMAACSRSPDTSPAEKPSASARPTEVKDKEKPAPTAVNGPGLHLEWDPETGKGAVVHRTPEGDRYRTCFHCGYPGYTGGLVIGSYNGSGFGYYPARPIRGHRLINLFCAQDESIWDLDEQKEHTYGWSENFGQGDDGTPLEFRKGQVVRQTDEALVLRSVNETGCYRVIKVAHTRAGAAWWIIATRIENVCDRPIRFDFFSGDDPWLGLYRSSDGDVGWTPAGLVQQETYFPPGAFSAGGVYDLGNAKLGQTSESFTGEANFMQLDPVSPRPDRTFFANSFAHEVGDIDPRRFLDNKTLTALNMGWTARTLDPGEGLTTAMAMGRAVTGKGKPVPEIPDITDEDWSVWRQYLREGAEEPKGALLFAAETVDIRIDSDEAVITGTYWVRNTGADSLSVGIQYPILTGPDRPAPETVDMNGRAYPVVQESDTLAESRFPLEVSPRGIKRFQVTYRQAHRKRRVSYMVTSANTWPRPLIHATFIVRHPKTFKNVRITYPAQTRTVEAGMVTHRIFVQPFKPDKEVEIVWGG